MNLYLFNSTYGGYITQVTDLFSAISRGPISPGPSSEGLVGPLLDWVFGSRWRDALAWCDSKSRRMNKNNRGMSYSTQLPLEK